ncbi:MAG TPA: serine/threonine-protein kinase, partial [Candidatus Thermoplasmatota archaeon]|nr:serine/threonine-protein kinase [Candidatus Thermoplasmatota archaeon]
QNVLLAGFLLLIATSFAADAMSLVHESLLWVQIDDIASALDPVLFLAFVTEHPYVRRTRFHRAALAWLAAAGALCAVVLVVQPSAIVAALAPAWGALRLLFVLGVTGFGYTVAWFAAVGSLRHAPTDGLAQRARWCCLAVGVALLPRLPFVPFNQLDLPSFGAGLPGQLAQLAAMLAVVGLLAGLALRQLRDARDERAARRVVLAAAGATALLLVEDAAVNYLGVNFSHPFALRWIVFSGVVVYAVLAHQVIRFPAVARRLLASVGAGIVGIIAASVALASVPEAAVGTWGVVAIAVGVGLAATLPGAWAARSVLAWAERAPGADGHAERRLALYSAAVESALAGGTPERLPRARRHLGLARDEARVVEDLVRRSLARPERTLRRGDEPLPGIVIERPLPGGAQGRTFLARRMPGGEAVVVKHLTALPAAARRQLWKQLDALRALRHPGIPRLLDFATDPAPCVAYDYVPGQTLAERLRHGPLPDRTLVPAVRDLLAALGAVHGAGFVHGDVKPSNVVLGRDGRAHLIDFGLVEARAPPRATLAGEARPQPAGTLEYMAPELARTGTPTAAADLFALGMAVQEAVTGKPARRLRGLAIYQALERVEREPVSAASAPRRWQPFLKACLQPDPRGRAGPDSLALLLPVRKASVQSAGSAAAATP